MCGIVRSEIEHAVCCVLFLLQSVLDEFLEEQAAADARQQQQLEAGSRGRAAAAAGKQQQQAGKAGQGKGGENTDDEDEDETDDGDYDEDEDKADGMRATGAQGAGGEDGVDMGVGGGQPMVAGAKTATFDEPDPEAISATKDRLRRAAEASGRAEDEWEVSETTVVMTQVCRGGRWGHDMSVVRCGGGGGAGGMTQVYGRGGSAGVMTRGMIRGV